jgi:hypothetical protein
MALAAEAGNFQWRNFREPIACRQDVMDAVAVVAAWSQRIAPLNRLPVQRLRMELLLG